MAADGFGAPVQTATLLTASLLVLVLSMAIFVVASDRTISFPLVPRALVPCTSARCAVAPCARTVVSDLRSHWSPEASGNDSSCSGDPSGPTSDVAATIGDTSRQLLGVQIRDCCGVWLVRPLLAVPDYPAEQKHLKRLMAIRRRSTVSGTYLLGLMRPGLSPEKGSETTTKNDTTQNRAFESHPSHGDQPGKRVHGQCSVCVDSRSGCPYELAVRGCHRAKRRMPATSGQRKFSDHVATSYCAEAEGPLNFMHSDAACDTMPVSRGSFHRLPFWRSYPHFPHTSPRGIS